MRSADSQQLVDGGRALDPVICQRARLARDPRFDGEFFVAVASTGIYCRPVCPARLPAERNVRYYRLAAQAANAGFRPCLRCRPESAPHSPAWRGSVTTLGRALELIREGALDSGGSVQTLADRLGVGARYLNKLFQRELGVAPGQVAHNQRLLLARQLIVDSELPLTQVAFAAGFGSVRRFNSAIRDAYGDAPGALRRRRQPSASTGIELSLRYRPPYDWDGVLEFFQRHAVPGIDRVDGNRYSRALPVAGGVGTVSLTSVPGRNALKLRLELPAGTPLLPLVAQARRVCDLDANPAAIAAVLEQDTLLRPLLRQRPGIRCPGYWTPEEAALRAVVGQQVSTVGARRTLAKIAAACATDAGLFPRPEALQAPVDQRLPMPARRRETLRSLGRLCASSDGLTPEGLASLKGVGPWTLAMTQLRGWGDPDAFPAGDLGLVKAWKALATDGASLTDHADLWQPFRGYAANLLWSSL